MACGLKISLFPLMELLGQLLRKLGTISVPVAADPEAAAQRADGVAVGNQSSGLAEIMLAVCFSAAIDIAIPSLQIQSQLLHISLSLVSLALLFAFSTFLMSMFLAAYKFTQAAQFLERAGVFMVVTGFFIVISIPFPLCLRVVTWVVYAIGLLVVLLCNYFFG